MSEQTEHPVNLPTESSQCPVPQKILGQAGHRDPFHYDEHIQATNIKGRKNTFLLDPHDCSQSVRDSFHHQGITGMDEGSVIETDTGHELFLLRPLLADYVLSMPRGTQVAYPRDSGQVIATGDIFPGARVLEAGVGSDTLTMNLLSAIGETGHLLSIERREDFVQVAASSVDAWFGRHRSAWELCAGDFAGIVAAQVEPSSIDRVVLDMLAPWENIEAVSQALTLGGPFPAYVATVTQLSRTVGALRHSGLFTGSESWGSMVHTWNIGGLAVRPDRRMVAHTGFLLTVRHLVAGSWPLTRERPPTHGAYDKGGYWPSDNVKEHASTDKKVRRVLRDCRAKRPSGATPVLSGNADNDQDGANHV